MSVADILTALGEPAPPEDMVEFALFDKATGEIVQVGVCPASALEFQGRGPAYGRIVIEPGVQARTHRVDPETETVVPYSEAGQQRRAAHPGLGFRWDAPTEAWVDERSIQAVAEDLDRVLQHRRDTLLEGGFEWDGSRFHSDAKDSQPRLLGLYGDALNGNYTEGGEWWKLQGGGWRLLQPADAIALWLTFKERMRTLYGVYGTHEATIGLMVEEGDLAGLRAYDVNWGWPE
jgi:hypothetical protein